MNRISWKEMIVGTLAGLSVMTAPAIGKINSSIAGPEVRVDNRGPGSLNSGRDIDDRTSAQSVCADDPHERALF